MLSGKQILIVDDMSAVRKSLARMVEQQGGRALVAADGETALLMLSEHPVDAFLLDIHLHGMDGTQLCQRIRSMERFRHTPVMFITSMAEEEIAVQAFAAGGDDIVGKPVSERVLCARLQHHLLRHQQTRQADALQHGLNQYLDSRTRDAVLAQVESGQVLQPQRRHVCVLFTDVRGFTQLSQTMEPTQLFNTLSEHLNAQVQAVYKHLGYIDKFSGDGLMAVFDDDDACGRACRCALEIIDYARQHAGSSALHQLGVGIHFGEVIAGNIGRERQKDYTIVGPTVNLAARLCGHAEAMSVIVSDAVKQQLTAAESAQHRFEFGVSKPIQVKGVVEVVNAHPLLRQLKTPFKEVIDPDL